MDQTRVDDVGLERLTKMDSVSFILSVFWMPCVLSVFNKAIRQVCMVKEKKFNSKGYSCIFWFNEENMCKNISFLDILWTYLFIYRPLTKSPLAHIYHKYFSWISGTRTWANTPPVSSCWADGAPYFSTTCYKERKMRSELQRSGAITSFFFTSTDFVQSSAPTHTN